MNDTLRQQFERLGFRLVELDNTLADGSVAADMKRYRALTREQAEVSSLVERYRRYQQREADLAAARELLDSGDAVGAVTEMQVGEEDGAEAVRPGWGERVHGARLEADVAPPK